MKIVKKTITVNGNSKAIFPFKGVDYPHLQIRLKEEFKTQGELYSSVFGADYDQAELAGWHPGHDDFNSTCEGWKTFIKDKGSIDHKIVVESVELDICFLEQNSI